MSAEVLLLELDGEVIGRFPVASSTMVVGRGRDVDIEVAVQGVSRRHAEVYRKPDGTVWVRDLGSANGTFVNTDRILAPQRLRPGDVLNFMDYGLVLEVDDSEETLDDEALSGRGAHASPPGGVAVSVSEGEGPAHPSADAIGTEGSAPRYVLCVSSLVRREAPVHLPIVHPVTVLGQGDGADVHLEGVGGSSRHSVLVVVQGELLLVRLASAPVLRVNGTARMTAFLRAGDVVELGDTRLEVRAS